MLPPLLSKHYVLGAFLDYPSRGEAGEATCILEKLGLEAKVSPAHGRVLRDQVWWNRFVVVAGTDCFDPAELQTTNAVSMRYAASWYTNDKNIPLINWKKETPTSKKSILGNVHTANPSGFVYLG